MSRLLKKEKKIDAIKVDFTKTFVCNSSESSLIWTVSVFFYEF